MYPLLNIPNRVTDLAAVQRGATVIYQFNLPALTTEGKQARIGRVELRIGDAGSPFNLSAWEENAKRIDVEVGRDQHVRGEMGAAPWVGKEVVLAVKVYGPSDKRDAGWSNLMMITVVSPLATPSDVAAVAVAEGVRVTWKGPPGQYQVLRRMEPENDFALVGTVEANHWIDTATEYKKKYEYQVLSVRKTGTVDVQSDLSEIVSVTPIDKFPPAVPTGLNAIAAAEGVELVWDRNTEPDLAVYRLYRALGGGKLAKIADIPDAPSYSDRKLESGKVYRYAVSAVDALGNASELSAPVEITAP
jgi:hypothetical protein